MIFRFSKGLGKGGGGPGPLKKFQKFFQIFFLSLLLRGSRVEKKIDFVHNFSKFVLVTIKGKVGSKFFRYFQKHFPNKENAKSEIHPLGFLPLQPISRKYYKGLRPYIHWVLFCLFTTFYTAIKGK